MTVAVSMAVLGPVSDNETLPRWLAPAVLAAVLAIVSVLAIVPLLEIEPVTVLLVVVLLALAPVVVAPVAVVSVARPAILNLHIEVEAAAFATREGLEKVELEPAVDLGRKMDRAAAMGVLVFMAGAAMVMAMVVPMMVPMMLLGRAFELAFMPVVRTRGISRLKCLTDIAVRSGGDSSGQETDDAEKLDLHGVGVTRAAEPAPG